MTTNDYDVFSPEHNIRMDVPVISRGEFFEEWDYGPGQHVTMLGPTQRGKTTLCLQLLQSKISPQHKAVILAGKPPGRDPTMEQHAAQALNLRVIEEWPPNYRYNDKKKNGYVLRPKQTMKDLDVDNENVRQQFRKAMMANYAAKPNKPVITVVDETHHVHNDMKLKKEYEAPLMRGAPVNAEWSLIQRGRNISYHAYSAPEHLFIFADPDKENRRRYSEIGGVDPRYLERLSETLKTYKTKKGNAISECIYIRRSGPEIMIIDVK